MVFSIALISVTSSISCKVLWSSVFEVWDQFICITPCNSLQIAVAQYADWSSTFFCSTFFGRNWLRRDYHSWSCSINQMMWISSRDLTTSSVGNLSAIKVWITTSNILCKWKGLNHSWSSLWEHWAWPPCVSSVEAAYCIMWLACMAKWSSRDCS